MPTSHLSQGSGPPLRTPRRRSSLLDDRDSRAQCPSLPQLRRRHPVFSPGVAIGAFFTSGRGMPLCHARPKGSTPPPFFPTTSIATSKVCEPSSPSSSYRRRIASASSYTCPCRPLSRRLRSATDSGSRAHHLVPLVRCHCLDRAHHARLPR